MTKIKRPRQHRRRDIARRINENHKRWVNDSVALCQMAQLSPELGMAIITAELTMCLIRAVAASDVDPDEIAKHLANDIRRIRKKHREQIDQTQQATE